MKTTVFSILAFLPIVAFAQFGVLDSDFDADGKLHFQVTDVSTRGTDVLVQSDGKILVCGYYTGQNMPAFYIRRLFPDGSLDNAFGVNGTAVVILNQVVLEIHAMALQSDGKIVVVGGVNGGMVGQIVMRLNGTDGLLDQTFGNGGYTLIPYSTTSFLFDVAIQSDGKIVAAGITAESDFDITVVRLNTDGSMDNTFSFDGKVVTDVDLADWAQGLVIGSDDKITIAGSTEHPGGNRNGLLVRYNADGTLDNSFGTAGKLEVDYSNFVDEFHNLAIDGAGSYYAVGATNAGGDYNMFVSKITPNGALDNNFSFDGIVEADFAFEDDRAWDVLLQPDGNILVVGSSENVNGKSLALLRLTGNGTLDQSFGTGGKVVTDAGTSDEYRAVTLQNDLKILAAGTIIDIQFNERNAIVARYTSGMNVGIGEVDAYIGSTLVYPNPITDNQVTIEYELQSDETVSIELFDLSGKMIAQLQPSIRQVAGSHQKTLALPSLSTGNYLLRLNTNSGSVSVQLSIQ